MNEMDFMCSYFYSHQNVRDNDPPNDDPTYPVKKFGDALGVSTINTWEMLIKKKAGAKVRSLRRMLICLKVPHVLVDRIS